LYSNYRAKQLADEQNIEQNRYRKKELLERKIDENKSKIDWSLNVEML